MMDATLFLAVLIFGIAIGFLLRSALREAPQPPPIVNVYVCFHDMEEEDEPWKMGGEAVED